MKKIIIVVLVLAVVAAVLWWYFKTPQKNGEISGIPSEQAAAIGDNSFGGTISEKVAPENPGSKLPDINPLNANVNPYSGGAYKNPFGQ